MFEQSWTICLTATLSILIFLSIQALPLWAQSSDERQAVQEVFEKYHEYEGFQGAVLVAKGSEIIYKDAFGLANREWNIPNQVDSRFDIASVSKQFTAMLVMQMYEEGKVHLDSTISSYYPEYRSDVAQKVTIHHLLTHRSGIPNYTSIPYVWSDSLVNRYSSDELVKKFCSGELEFEPGSRYSYNNSGYFILSVILEKVSEQPFEVLLQDKILKPLKLYNTGTDDRKQVLDKRSYGYVQDDNTFENAKPMYMANLQGAGNMYATVEDLYLWDRALHQGRLLSKHGHKLMTSEYSPKSNTWIPPYQNSYGYGVGTAQVPGPSDNLLTMVFHSGHITGYSSFIARFVDDEHLVVMLSNQGEVSTARMNEVAQQVKNVLYGLPYEIPNRSLKSLLYKKIRQSGINAALREYDKLTKAFPYEFGDTEQELYLLSQELAQKGRNQACLDICYLNARVNPNWKTYQALGNAYYVLRQPEQANIYYQKSIDSNPQTTNVEKAAYASVSKSLSNAKQ